MAGAAKLPPGVPTAETRRRMRATRQKDTKPELLLRSVLHRAGLRFRVQYGLPDLRRRADIAFPRHRIAVFVDGCFWHGCPEHGTWPKNNAKWWREKIEANRARDRDTDMRLAGMGWTAIRVWEHEKPEEASAAIEIALRRIDPNATSRVGGEN